MAECIALLGYGAIGMAVHRKADVNPYAKVHHLRLAFVKIQTRNATTMSANSPQTRIQADSLASQISKLLLASFLKSAATKFD